MVVVIAAALLAWLARRLLPVPPMDLPGSGWLALGIAAGGLVPIVLGLRSFQRAGTTVDPLAPANASTLVTGGIYRWSRNPMYLGFALLLTAWCVWLATAPGLLVVPAFVLYMNRFQIGPEERALEARFGEEYRVYRGAARRWL